MPRDGSGSYTLPVGNPVVSGTLIESSWANSTLSDIAVQLNNVLTRDGVLGPILPFKLVDGAVATPGLAFNSEPGLGFYRSGSGTIRFAAINANTMELNAATGTNTSLNLWPRLGGPPQSSQIVLSGQPFGTVNRSDLIIQALPTDVTISSVPAGTDTIRNITYSALAHVFKSNNSANASGIFSTPATDFIRLTLNKGATNGTFADILGSRGGLARWQVALGDGTSEIGSSQGSDFTITRYNDAGSPVSQMLTMSRFDASVIWKSGRFDVGNAAGSLLFRVIQQATSTVLVQGDNFTSNATASYFGGGVVCQQNLIMNQPGSTFTMNGTSPIGFWAYGGATPRAITFTDTNTGGSGFGFQIYNQFVHNPGVNAYNRVVVGSNAFDMLNNGTGNSVGGWVATSDRRLKTNIRPIAGALSKLLTLTGSTFDREDMVDINGVVPRKAGYIAQEVQAVLPEAVLEGSDERKILSVDHNGVIGLLIEAVKEVNARIDQALLQA